MKKILTMILALSLLCTAAVAFGEGPGGGRGGFGGNGGMRGGAGGMTDKSSDAELQSMIAEIAPKFQLLTYKDTETDTSLQYQLYIPENYDASQSYPMIQFIPDSSVVGKGTDAVLTQGWGGLIWATETEQEKHSAFVVVPVFTETIVDDNHNHSGQIDVAMRMLQSLTETYSIDTSRIYTTGQSMGGMTSFYESIAYPDFFAAYLFVGSQWDVSVLKGLEEKPFFYIVSAGDPKASAGQTELRCAIPLVPEWLRDPDRLRLRLSLPERDADAARLADVLRALPRPALADLEFALLAPFDANSPHAADYIPEVLWPWEG